MNGTWSDEEIIQAIREGGKPRRLATEYLYKTLYQMALGMVKRYGLGDELRVDEIFTYVLVDVLRRVARPEFVLTNKLSSYFMTAFLRKWTVGQQQLVLTQPFDPKIHLRDEISASVEDDFIRAERHESVRDALDTLGERCKKLLTMFSNGYSMEEIATEMGFQNEQVAKNQAMSCRGKLRAILQKNIVSK